MELALLTFLVVFVVLSAIGGMLQKAARDSDQAEKLKAIQKAAADLEKAIQDAIAEDQRQKQENQAKVHPLPRRIKP